MGPARLYLTTIRPFVELVRSRFVFRPSLSRSHDDVSFCLPTRPCHHSSYPSTSPRPPCAWIPLRNHCLRRRGSGKNTEFTFLLHHGSKLQQLYRDREGPPVRWCHKNHPTSTRQHLASPVDHDQQHHLGSSCCDLRNVQGGTPRPLLGVYHRECQTRMSDRDDTEIESREGKVESREGTDAVAARSSLPLRPSLYSLLSNDYLLTNRPRHTSASAGHAASARSLSATRGLAYITELAHATVTSG